MLGIHRNERPLEITVNAGPPFRRVKNVKLFLKGESDILVDISVDVMGRLGKYPFSYHPRPRMNIRILNNQFEVMGEFTFSTDTAARWWSYIEDVDASFGLFLVIHDRELKPGKRCTVNINEAFLLVEAESQAPSIDISTLNKIYTSDSRIVFMVSSYGEDGRNGFFINQDGEIWKYLNIECHISNTQQIECQPKYSRSCKDKCTHSLFQDIFGLVKFIGSIDKDIMVKHNALIAEASQGQLISKHTGNDIGLETHEAFLFDKKNNLYEAVVLNVRADTSVTNTSSAAAILVTWLKEIEKQIKYK